jgi:hypothetical protein
MSGALRKLEYKNSTNPPPHFKVYTDLRQRNIVAPNVGDRIAYIIVSGSGSVGTRAHDPIHVLENELCVDVAHYNKLLMNQVTSILQAVFKANNSVKDLQTALSRLNAVNFRHVNRPPRADRGNMLAYVQRVPKNNCAMCDCSSTAKVCASCLASYTDEKLRFADYVRDLEDSYQKTCQTCMTCVDVTDIEDVVCSSPICDNRFLRRETGIVLSRKKQILQNWS